MDRFGIYLLSQARILGTPKQVRYPMYILKSLTPDAATLCPGHRNDAPALDSYEVVIPVIFPMRRMSLFFTIVSVLSPFAAVGWSIPIWKIGKISF